MYGNRIRQGNVWAKPTLFLDKQYGLYNFMPTSSGVFYAGSNANEGSKNDYSTYDFCTLTIAGWRHRNKKFGIAFKYTCF